MTFGERYQVQQELGSGGMATVHKAYDAVDRRTVALKRLAARHLGSPEFLLRFRNEFRLLSQLRHPNMVQVFDYGFDREGVPFLVMEYVDGRLLAEFGRIPADRLAELLGQLCQALAYLHGRGYLHRDLKPSNVKVQPDGLLKLLDYGLMCQPGYHPGGKIAGTLYYMAPEVITGGLIDETTDLYALGVIVYELLCGRPPFVGSRNEILAAHLHALPAPVTDIRPGVPVFWDRLIARLLAKEKEKRYANASELLVDLRQVAGIEIALPAIAAAQTYLLSDRLIGRTREMARVKDWLGVQGNRLGKAVFFGAAAGLGKTRLLQTIKVRAQLEGCQSFWISSGGLGDRLYGWVAEVARCLNLSFRDDLDAPYGSLLSSIEEEKGQFDDETVTAGLASCLRAASRISPLVIFSDDLHWCDAKSLGVLNEMIRRLAGAPILFVSAFRHNEVEKTAAVWQTIREGRSEYWELAPLGDAEARQLLNDLLRPAKVSDDFVQLTFGACGGNPFDLIELLRYLMDEGHLSKIDGIWAEPVNLGSISVPASQGERVVARLKKLGNTALEIAEIASVMGDRLTLETWRALSGMEDARFFDAVDELARHQVIGRTEGDCQFSHFRIREAIYSSLSASRRRRLHLRAAQLMAAANGNDLPVGAIARHFAEADAGREAISYSLQAARLAEAARADWLAFNHYRTAVRFLEADASHPARESLLIDAYEKAGQLSSAAWIDAATCFTWLDKAIDHYTRRGDEERVFGLSLSRIVASAITSDYEGARRKIDDLCSITKVKAGSLSWAILHGAGVCLVDWYQGHQQDCFDHASAAISLFEEYGEALPPAMWPAFAWSLFWREKAKAYMGMPLEMANIERVRSLVEQGRADLTIYWHTLTAVGARAAFTGRYQDLTIWKDLASRLSRKMGKIYWFECWISHSYLYAALDRWDLSQVNDHIALVAASPDPYQVRLAHLFGGRSELLRGNPGEALHKLKIFLDEEEQCRDNSYLEGLYYFVHALLQTKRLEEAELLISRGLDAAVHGLLRNPFYKLRFSRLAAELARAQGDRERAAQFLAAAQEIAETLDNPIQKAYIAASRGELYRDAGEMQLAVESSAMARDIFGGLGNRHQAAGFAKLVDDMEDSLRSPRGGAMTEAKEIVLDPSFRTTEIDSPQAITIFDIEVDIVAPLSEGARTTVDDPE